MTERRLLTIKEAAAALSLSPKTLWAWRARRQIGIVQVGRRSVRVDQSEIDRILAEGTVPAREQN
jgi:excisionase family DNA binding protein